ncbi:Homocysteine S-methyltransferase [Schizophyllum amplum]|uniref:Homocysteine S-methyltransferase n=1 Tax=Schizophyllum amplum TaxID=97359 RepID=A0A550CZG6_9AGAR|nr:Homocysteine S-methyltransferase [Auriculariopsis ampla]
MFNIPAGTSYLVLDGGLGTTLEDVFHVDVSHTELWSAQPILEDPQIIVDAHLAFLRAGADLLSTATYQCSYRTFERAGYSKADACTAMTRAVRLADEARRKYCEESGKTPSDIKIALSLGPFGASLSPAQEYDGCYPPPFGPKAYSAVDANNNAFPAGSAGDEAESLAVQALVDFHLERLRVFSGDHDAWRAIDVIAFETVPLLREIKALRIAMTRLRSELRAPEGNPWWLSVVFPQGQFPEKRRDQSNAAREVTEVVHAVFAAFSISGDEMDVPDGVGVNCTDIAHYPALVATMASEISATCSERPVRPWLVLYPNGGDVYDPVSRTWKEGTGKGDTWADKLVDAGTQAVGAGVWGGLVLGGCCRCGPDEIRQLAQERASSTG